MTRGTGARVRPGFSEMLGWVGTEVSVDMIMSPMDYSGVHLAERGGGLKVAAVEAAPQFVGTEVEQLVVVLGLLFCGSPLAAGRLEFTTHWTCVGASFCL